MDCDIEVEQRALRLPQAPAAESSFDAETEKDTENNKWTTPYEKRTENKMRFGVATKSGMHSSFFQQISNRAIRIQAKTNLTLSHTWRFEK